MCITHVQEVYKYLHSIPEKGFEEVKTAEYLSAELRKFGYEVTTGLGKTGVIGVLDSGKEGIFLGLRADMDALEYVIDGEVEYRHTCGHDAHSSMVLAAAKKIAKAGIESGKIMIIFQPAEETLFGALRMVETGALDGIEELIGLHIRPMQEAKVGEATPALTHSASTVIRAVIKGKTAHGARPHLGTNVLDAMNVIMTAVNAIRIDPNVSHSIKLTKLQAGGSASNIIPDEAEICFDIRCSRNDVMSEILTKVKMALEFGAKSVGATSQITLEEGVPAAEYDDDLVSLVDEAIIDVLGEGSSLGTLYTPGGEDFHYLTQKLKCKSAYVGLGSGATPGLHHQDMTFDLSCLDKGVDVLCNIVDKRLGLK